MLPMVLATILLTTIVNSVPVFEEITPFEGEACDFESCPATQEGVLNVHLIPHTHDDVGWLKTVDQYYYGSRNNIQKAGVQYILDSVISELWADPDRRFIYVETAFFWKWWTQQSDDVRHKVHVLVRQGRLQFVGGAWSMNDEASTHYQSTIDQFTWGLRKLNDTFGRCGVPRVAWQIDPFGHARELANLLALMGYKGLFLGRIDYQDKRSRLLNKDMEMLWRGDDDLGKPSDIFTNVLYNHYSPPSGFCFDVLCSDEPIVDDPASPMYNVDARIASFLQFVQNQKNFYRTNNAIVTMGGDFTYQDSRMWYKNLDKLIKYANLKAAKEGLNIKLFYSTPTCYLKSVKSSNPSLPTKQDDFFPYASDSTAYWTGYFTSRPTIKYFERLGNNYLQMAKQLQVLANLEEHNRFVLDELRSAMGIMQHHDAVTGTEKQHVAADYERILDEAIEDSLIIARQAIRKFSQTDDAAAAAPLSLSRCAFNQSECSASEKNDRFIVTLYNPVAWTVKASPIRIPVKSGQYSVFGPDGKEVTSQLVELPEDVLKIPTRKSDATEELVFMAEDLPALGHKSYYVKKEDRVKRDLEEAEKRRYEFYSHVNDYWKDLRDGKPMELQNLQTEKMGQVVMTLFGEKVGDLEKLVHGRTQKKVDFGRNGKYHALSEEEMRMLSDDPMVVDRLLDDYLENENIKIRIDNETGKITHLLLNDMQLPLNIELLYYPGCVGNNQNPAQRSSGAYIFRPNSTEPIEIKQDEKPKVVKGSVVDEVWLRFSDYASAVVRVYKGSGVKYLEVEWLVGPIPIGDDTGKEIVVRYSTDLINNGIFYTDSNGRQMIQRRLNRRPQYNVTLEEPVAGNYYPVTNKMYIEDSQNIARISVVTDRAQGGTSLKEGDLELMLHRRLLHDDAFGVGEALNETLTNGVGLVARGKHFVYANRFDDKDSVVEQKKNALEIHLQPQVFVSDAKDLEFDVWLRLKNEFSTLAKNLPDGLHLLTLEPWKSGLLLRLENYLDKSDSGSDLEFDLDGLFKGLRLVSLKETTLAANQWLDEDSEWDWETDEFAKDFNSDYGVNDFVRAEKIAKPKNVEGFKIDMPAKAIRTFIVEYESV